MKEKRTTYAVHKQRIEIVNGRKYMQRSAVQYVLYSTCASTVPKAVARTCEASQDLSAAQCESPLG